MASADLAASIIARARAGSAKPAAAAAAPPNGTTAVKKHGSASTVTKQRQTPTPAPEFVAEPAAPRRMSGVAMLQRRQQEEAEEREEQAAKQTASTNVKDGNTMEVLQKLSMRDSDTAPGKSKPLTASPPSIPSESMATQKSSVAKEKLAMPRQQELSSATNEKKPADDEASSKDKATVQVSSPEASDPIVVGHHRVNSKAAMFEEKSKNPEQGYSKHTGWKNRPTAHTEGRYLKKTTTKFDEPPPAPKKLSDLP